MLEQSLSMDSNDLTAYGTLASAIFTAAAAYASLRSARASEKAIKDLERPWLFLETIHFDGRNNVNRANDWFISLEWKNAGRMPAIIKECSIKFADKKKISNTPDYSNSGFLGVQQTVSPNLQFTTTKVGPALELNENDAIYIAYGKLTYTELNGTVHHTGYAVEIPAYMRPALISSKYANEKYNYFD